VKKLNQTKCVKKTVCEFVKIVKQIDDPRIRHCDYPLHEVLFIAIVTVLCGGNSYPDMETFGNAQLKWLKKFLVLENGIPSHDTFLRVFQLLKPESLEDVYRYILGSIKHKGKHIAIDGKASRGCYSIKGQSLLHTVSAWDTETGIALGQIATKNEDGKEVGEYETIPKLVKTLDIKDTLVTIDAGGCYAEIVESIVEGGGQRAVASQSLRH
ncbi:MAG: ISAs1 family transposase, partial [Thermoguttaceae bacterium]